MRQHHPIIDPATIETDGHEPVSVALISDRVTVNVGPLRLLIDRQQAKILAQGLKGIAT